MERIEVWRTWRTTQGNGIFPSMRNSPLPVALLLLAFVFGFAIGERRHRFQARIVKSMRDYVEVMEKRQNPYGELQIAIEEIVPNMDRNAIEKN